MRDCSYQSVVKNAESKLEAAGCEKYTAILLMRDLFDVTRTTLLLKGGDTMPDHDILTYEGIIEKVVKGLPYQYAVGTAWFYGERFTVNRDVLIPRNETEELVEKVLIDIHDDDQVIVDIGTGSGVIPITLKRHWKRNRVIATDISTSALNVAKTNNNVFQTDVEFFEGDLFEPIIKAGITVDVVISNPPYISKDEISLMTPSTVQHEPPLALYAEEGGLQLYKRMIEDLPLVLKENGYVYFEIGYTQGEVLSRYVKEIWPKTHPKVLNDINNNPRVLHFMWER